VDPAEILASAIEALGDRVVHILRSRTFADKPATLDSIGASMNVTRERVRQLEVKALLALRSSDDFDVTASMFAGALEPTRNVAPLTNVLEGNPVLASPVDVVNQPLWKILDRLDDNFEVASGWWCRKNVKSAVTATRGQVFGIADGRRSIRFAEIAWLDGEPWATEWFEFCGFPVLESHLLLASGGVADRSEVILEVEGSPLLLGDIVGRIGRKRSAGSIRNALAEDDRFARVDRNSWGLATWGLESYESIRRLIGNELHLNGGSVRLTKLVAKLTERFSVSSASVVAYASGRPFVTVDGIVEFGADEAKGSRKQPIDTRRVFRLPSCWAFRFAVTGDHLRGSGYAIPSSIGSILDLKRGEATTRPSRFGVQRFTWKGQQLALGSVRRFFDLEEAAIGDTYFLLFGDDGGFDLVRGNVPATAGLDRALALAGLGLNGSEANLAALARAVGASENAGLHQVADRLRVRGDFDIADAALASA
jgi:hypothetical protein